MRKNKLLQDIRKIIGLHLGIMGAVIGLSQQLHAHGEAAEMVPLYQNMSDFGANVKKDDFTGSYTISKGSLTVRAKPNSNTVLVNGKPLKVTVPLLEKNGQAVVSTGFINEVFQSGLDKTFTVESTPHPLNGLSAAELKEAYDILQKSKYGYENMRFSEFKLKAPDKTKVWDSFINHTPFTDHRIASFNLLKGNTAIEGEVDLNTKEVVKWTVLENTHGMVLLDNFEAVQKAIENSADYRKALKKRGINDVKKVIANPLTVGYFGGKDGLNKELNVLKVVSYLDTGDGNYWAHPIENLVAVVDLNQGKVIRIEEASLIPVPMASRPYVSKNTKTPPKPLNMEEPEGKNFSISGQTIHWGNW